MRLTRVEIMQDGRGKMPPDGVKLQIRVVEGAE
jgi:hypothetical protein